MSSLLERIALGNQAMSQDDYKLWQQEVGSAPPDRFQQAATDAIRQVPPDHYAQHLQSVDGRTPLHRVQAPQRTSIASALMSALLGHGVNQNEIQQQSNLTTLDPRQMTPEQIAGLLQYTQHQHPEALGQVAQQYQDRPSLLHTILGNGALVGLAIGLGSQLLANQLGGGLSNLGNQQQQRPTGGPSFM